VPSRKHYAILPSSYRLTSNSYWNWSLDAVPEDRNSTAPYETEIFSPTTGFGGTGDFVELAPGQDIFGFTAFGRSGGGCVQDGPFTRPNFQVNIGEAEGGACLRRDFTPGLFNFFADPAQLQRTLNEPTFNDFAHTLEGAASFAVANIHGSGHFGVGGVLGQAGNAANSPGGKSSSSVTTNLNILEEQN
jgi:tyrosinase